MASGKSSYGRKAAKRLELPFIDLDAEIEKKFGKNIVLAWGDWGRRRTQMRGCAPTKGIGMIRSAAKRFPVFLVHEFRTSKLCSKCHQELEHLEIRKNADEKKKVWGCKICRNCTWTRTRPDSNCNTREKRQQPMYWQRDLNATLNIGYLAKEWINHGRRPQPFCRNEPEIAN